MRRFFFFAIFIGVVSTSLLLAATLLTAIATPYISASASERLVTIISSPERFMAKLYTPLTNLSHHSDTDQEIAKNSEGIRGAVLAASDSVFNKPSTINFNLDTILNNNLLVQKDATIEGNLTVQGTIIGADNLVTGLRGANGITITGTSTNPIITNTGVTSFQGLSGAVTLTAGNNITIEGNKISATTGLSAGNGVSVSGSTITNNDPGSAQNIFKTFAVNGQGNILASSNDDTFTFVEGSGITLTTDATTKKLTIASTGASASGVSSLNSLTGVLTIGATGINSLSISGSTLTIDGVEADTLSTVTGRGASTNTAVTFNGGISTTDVNASGNIKSGGTTMIDSSRNVGNVAGISTNLNPTAANTYSLGTSTANQYSQVNAQTIYQNGNQICDTTGNCAGSGGGVIGSGTTNYVAKFSNSNTIANSLIYDNGTNVGIGTSNPDTNSLLTVAGNIVPSQDLTYDIGSPTLRYNHVYADNITASGSASFNDVIIAGKTNLIVDNTNLANGKDVFVYEVKTDADGGKWINSEKVQANSWYNEAIDNTGPSCVLGTNDRCGSRSFPQKVSIVATNSHVYIYDTTDNSLWMTINTGSGFAIDSSATINAVHALNGSIYIATTKGLLQFDFINDAIYRFDYNSGSGGRAAFLGNIGQRNLNKGFGNRSSWGQIASDQVNGVYATLINGKLFVAVSTLGGASVIDISDQRVVRYINN